MQATSTPALAQPQPSAFGALTAAVILAVGIGAGAIIGVNLAKPADVAPAAGIEFGRQATGGFERQRNGEPAITTPGAAAVAQRSGETGALSPAQRSLLDQRRGETGAAAAAAVDALTSDDFLASVGFRREHSGIRPNKAVAGPAMGNGSLIWLGTNPGSLGKLADDQMATFNGYGLSQPGADETEKIGRAHR
jgi:hypothetical protein